MENIFYMLLTFILTTTRAETTQTLLKWTQLLQYLTIILTQFNKAFSPSLVIL